MYYYAIQEDTIYFFEQGQPIYSLEQNEDNVLESEIFSPNSISWNLIEQNLVFMQITKELYSRLVEIANECIKQEGIIRVAYNSLHELSKAINIIKLI